MPETWLDNNNIPDAGSGASGALLFSGRRQDCSLRETQRWRFGSVIHIYNAWCTAMNIMVYTGPEHRHTTGLRVLSPALFTLFTSDCSAIHSTNTIVKFADDTTIVWPHIGQ
ncbi:hypothetical protein L3Q82_009460 [Scortum barcoo]|uniref:Uncharacterized protein n=1 Tax=Scortum barcoo TaxID=214431 RepID=A0ACB8WG76_9TELE|nr:hypothetical protein L3Q82_009460 [Scortum barcoo]